jgi:hypothetical protein
MRRSIVVVLTLLLVAVLAVPAFGAELEVSGKYVGEIEYNRTLVNSINADGVETPGFDLLGMSTLYLTLDFAEGETVEGHLPLMFYIDGDGGFAVEPSDSFWVVYRGYPFRISLSNQANPYLELTLIVQTPFGVFDNACNHTSKKERKTGGLEKRTFTARKKVRSFSERKNESLILKH